MDELLLQDGDSLELEDGLGSLLLEDSAPPPPSGLPRFWYGPLWPLQPLTLVTPGTGIEITDGYTSSDLESSEYNEAVAMGFILSCPSTNSDPMYLLIQANDGSFSKDNPGTIVLVIEPGTVKHFPQAAYGSNRYAFTMFAIDGETADDVIYICALMQ